MLPKKFTACYDTRRIVVIEKTLSNICGDIQAEIKDKAVQIVAEDKDAAIIKYEVD